MVIIKRVTFALIPSQITYTRLWTVVEIKYYFHHLGPQGENQVDDLSWLIYPVVPHNDTNLKEFKARSLRLISIYYYFKMVRTE